jgi:hypothetical protein
LKQVGFGTFRDANGRNQVAAVLDIRSGLQPGSGPVPFPLFFPGDGRQTWVLRYSLPEYPDARAACPGYGPVTGAPILLQMGSGNGRPTVTGTSLEVDGVPVEHCVFTESTYTNPNEFGQKTGRTILDQRDAIVILPRSPLKLDATYNVRVTANGQNYSWSFDTVPPPPP